LVAVVVDPMLANKLRPHQIEVRAGSAVAVVVIALLPPLLTNLPIPPPRNQPCQQYNTTQRKPTTPQQHNTTYSSAYKHSTSIILRACNSCTIPPPGRKLRVSAAVSWLTKWCAAIHHLSMHPSACLPACCASTRSLPDKRFLYQGLGKTMQCVTLIWTLLVGFF